MIIFYIKFKEYVIAPEILLTPMLLLENASLMSKTNFTLDPRPKLMFFFLLYYPTSGRVGQLKEVFYKKSQVSCCKQYSYLLRQSIVLLKGPL